MAKKVTSKKVATEASKILRDKHASKRAKSVAGSDLSQREKPKRKKSKQKNSISTVMFLKWKRFPNFGLAP